MDEFTETTSQGWGSRITGSIKGVVVGIVLFVAAFPVLFLNEGCARKRQLTYDEVEREVKPADSASVDSASDGKLVHMSGEAVTDEILADEEFGVQANAIKLKRTVEMYQWHEKKESKSRKKVGGRKETTTTYRYVKNWSAALIDSSKFRKPAGHENPGSMPYESKESVAESVALGAFKLSPDLIAQIDKAEPLPVGKKKPATAPTPEAPPRGPSTATSARPGTDAGPNAEPGAEGDTSSRPGTGARPNTATRPGTAAAPDTGPRPGTGAAATTDRPATKLKVAGGGYYIGADPASAQIGDVRIKFSVVRPTTVSIIAQQSGDSFESYVAKTDQKVSWLSVGKKSAHEMIADKRSASRLMTWLGRLGGFLMMAIGIAMVFRPLAVLADVLPILGDILRMGIGIFAFIIAFALSLVTIAIAWLFYRPVLAIILIAVAVGAFVGIKKLAAGKKARQAAPAAQA